MRKRLMNDNQAKSNIYRLRGAIIENGRIENGRNIYDICEEIGIFHKGLLKDLARGEMTSYVRLYALCSASRITPDDVCAVRNDDQRRKET